MLELIWFARGIVALGLVNVLAALLLPGFPYGALALDRRTVGLVGIAAVVVGAILVAVAGA